MMPRWKDDAVIETRRSLTSPVFMSTAGLNAIIPSMNIVAPSTCKIQTRAHFIYKNVVSLQNDKKVRTSFKKYVNFIFITRICYYI